jgi:hypothetical protein
MGGISSLNWGVTGSLTVESSDEKKKSFQNSAAPKHVQVIQIASPVIQSTSNLLSKVGVTSVGPFPKPGSEDCLWRKALRQIATDFNLLKIGSLPHHSPAIIGKITKSLLRDRNSFPGRVAFELRNLFLALVFSSDREILTHGREMLDNISCSIFILLPADLSQDLYLRLVITIVDWFVLREHDGSIYDHLWNAAHRLTATMDQILVNKLLEEGDGCASPSSLSSLPQHQQQQLEMRLSSIPCEYSGMDKLKRLVQVLKSLSASTALSQQPDDGNQSEQFVEQDLSVDADLLMKRFIDLIAFYTVKYEVYWHAECLFIEFLCTESSWANDAEGYAFVSLQQALRTLCPHAAIASAALNRVEVCVTEEVDPPSQGQSGSGSGDGSSSSVLGRGGPPINSE